LGILQITEVVKADQYREEEGNFVCSNQQPRQNKELQLVVIIFGACTQVVVCQHALSYLKWCADDHLLHNNPNPSRRPQNPPPQSQMREMKKK
jgi:hypothetical protein